MALWQRSSDIGASGADVADGESAGWAVGLSFRKNNFIRGATMPLSPAWPLLNQPMPGGIGRQMVTRLPTMALRNSWKSTSPLSFLSAHRKSICIPSLPMVDSSMPTNLHTCPAKSQRHDVSMEMGRPSTHTADNPPGVPTAHS